MRVLSRSVDPRAKYQCADADEAHGVLDQPTFPITLSSTPAPPPSRSTMAPTAGACTTSARLTVVRDLAPTGAATVRPAAPVGTAVIRAVVGSSLGLRI